MKVMANNFSVGHDVPELLNASDDSSLATPLEGLFPYTLSKPVLAAVEGRCYGLGFELALACDLRIAAEDARLGFPDTNLPVSYRLASVLLPRMTNVGIGLDLLLTGEVMDAAKMQQMRLVSQVAPPGQALAQAVETAQEMVRNRREQRKSHGPLPTPLPADVCVQVPRFRRLRVRHSRPADGPALEKAPLDDPWHQTDIGRRT